MGNLDFGRVLSVISAGILIIMVFPVLILIILILAITLKGNPFFTQLRPGINGKLFRLIKLRTMTNAKDRNGKLLQDADRLTSVGKIVRSLSLDELPQLLNILKGEMSFVGPRPLLPEYLSLYNEEQKRRHDVKPGLTGWAQVNGRNAISWDEKFELDVWYVDHKSVLIDLKILWMTVQKVFRRDGISSKASATMEKFKGTK